MKALTPYWGRYLTPLLGRGWGRLFMLVLILFTLKSYAQTVPIPNPNWPRDSVINGAIKHFTVQGDVNYKEPSTFTWHVYGGRMFFDEGLTQLAGDGSTCTVLGNESNVTDIWVIWDVFTQPIDYGYIYVTELSSNGCQKPDSDETKFIGMNIKVKAPPDVRFLTNETLTCSNEEGVLVEIEIDGFAPFDIKYSYRGEIRDWHVEPGEMVDSDFDGKENNLVIPINDYTGTTIDKIYQLELISAESEGVFGDILEYPTHTVYAFVQPSAPEIFPTFTDVTVGTTHQMLFVDPGENVAEWTWELYDEGGTLAYETTSATIAEPEVVYYFDPGNYYWVAYYKSLNGCISLTDTVNITIYEPPQLAFADTSVNAVGCSAVTTDPDDSYEFTLEYKGALYYDFTYAVYDYNNVLLAEYSLEQQTERVLTLSIPNTFINDALPGKNRTWRVVITGGVNVEGVNITIPPGKSERTITVHPKPVITDDIDFAN